MFYFSARKRPRASGQSILEVLYHDNCTSNKILERRKGRVSTYQLAFCLGVLLVQLARVHSWSPSSFVAKKSPPYAAVQIPRESDTLSGVPSAEGPRIPSLELPSSIYRIKNPVNKDDSNNLLKMAASPPGSQQSNAPSMLIADSFFFPMSSKNTGFARSSSDSVGIGGSNIAQSEEKSSNGRERRVLGFDVFELHAKHPENSAGEEVAGPIDDSESLLSSSGLTWQNLPLSTTADSGEISSPAVTQVTDVSPSLTTASGKRNGGVRLLRYSSPLLPAWFPWIPTKSQIMTLKLKELREACSQRGLAKVCSLGFSNEALCSSFMCSIASISHSLNSSKYVSAS